MHRLLLAPVLGVILLLAGPDPLSAQTPFTHKFTAGETFVYELTTDINQVAIESGGKEAPKPRKEQSTQVLTIETTVDKVSDAGVADLRLKIIKLKMAMDVPTEGRITFDSDNADAVVDIKNIPGQRIAQMGKQMLGTEWTLQLDPQGKMLNLRASRNNAARPTAGQPPLAEDGMREISAQFFTPLAESAVDAGGDWTRKLATKTQYGSLRTVQKYTYSGDNDKGQRKFTLAEEYDPQVDQKIPLKVDLTGGEGEILFDSERGRAVRGKKTQTLTMEISFGDKKMKMEQKVQSKQAFRLVEAGNDPEPEETGEKDEAPEEE